MRNTLFGCLVAIALVCGTTSGASAQYGYYGTTYSPYSGTFTSGATTFYPGVIQTAVTSYSPFTGAYASTYGYNSYYGGSGSTYGYSPFYGYGASTYTYSPYAGIYRTRNGYFRR